MNAPVLPSDIPPQAVGSVPGHNMPPVPLAYDPDVYAELKSSTKAFVEASNAWLKTDIESDEQAGMLADQISGLGKVGKKVEAARVAAKKPHMDAATAVDAAHNPLLDMVKRATSSLKAHAAKWTEKKIAIETQRKADEKRKADELAAEALRLKMDAEASGNIEDVVAAEQAEKTANKAVKVAAKPIDVAIRSASGAGRTLSYRSRTVATLTNINLAYKQYRDAPELAELLVRLANAEANSKDFPEGGTIPGFDLTVSQSIA